jgi:transglutaminase superfamily protein
VRLTCVLVLAACAPTARPAPDAPLDTSAADRESRFRIYFGGARVGTAIERETWSPAGVTVQRDERVRFLRGAAEVRLATTIEILADRALAPLRVTWTERAAGQTRRGTAVRDGRGWAVQVDGTTTRLPADARPAELAPLVVRRDGRFAGRVFLPARGFLAGTGTIEPVAPHRLIARLALAGGATSEATIDVTDDGSYARIVDGEGVIAIRSPDAPETDDAFEPVDLVAATAIAITGTGRELVLDGDLALPPVPGQLARPGPGGTGIALVLARDLAGALPAGPPGPDRTRAITALVARVRTRIAPDLGAGPASPRTASAATAGDCTTFALAYAALATHAAIPTRVVTGLRVDGDRLVRHRWAVSWTGRSWIAVDAAFGAAPAGGDLIGLAVHDADDAGLVAGEAALTHVHAASRR